MSKRKQSEYRIHIPNKVRLVGKDYLLVENTAGLARMGALGTTSNLDALIDYSMDQSLTQLRDTLLHEVIHAVDYSMCLGLEERQVHALAAGLLGVLRDNPGFTALLLQPDPEVGQQIVASFTQNDGSVIDGEALRRSVGNRAQHVRSVK